MTFKIPEAKKENIEKLLEYLGNTELYSEFYDGNRAEDFKKCFDTENPLCWEYAELVLRGIGNRSLTAEDAPERHHIVPFSFYVEKYNGGGRWSRKIAVGNDSLLTCEEHFYAHYCLAMCGIGDMRGKMANACFGMYHHRGSHKGRKNPLGDGILELIDEYKIKKVRSLITRVQKVDAEGRTHKWEDPVRAQKESIDKYRFSEHGKAKRKAYLEAHEEENKVYFKAYRDSHKEDASVYNKQYREGHREELAEYQKNYAKENQEHLREYRKEYGKKNAPRISANHAAYYQNNKEKIKAQVKARSDAKIAAGYRQRKNPVTGKREWMFVGVVKTAEAA